MAKLLRAIESDESGAPAAVYEVEQNILTTPLQRTPLLQKLINVFLPAGFPSSVTDDYVGYQIFDSLQAFSSSIAQLLTSRAVLQGFGVGWAFNPRSTAYILTTRRATQGCKCLCDQCFAAYRSARYLRLIPMEKESASLVPPLADASGKDTAGRLATILFAHKFGTALEAECKTYRFAADIFNDLAMVMDCLSPLLLPSAPIMRIGLLCLSGVFRAMCGVAGGASKASLSVHFARSGNVGELNAKDSSQETVISLLGMLAGSIVVSHVTGQLSTWVLLIFLLAVHLATNYKAVQCVSMNTLNRQRCIIVFAAFHDDSIILSPAQASGSERILTSGDTLRWRNNVIGSCHVGARFSALLTAIKKDAGDFSVEDDKMPVSWSTPKTLASLTAILGREKHLLWVTARQSRGYRRRPLNSPHVVIVLILGAEPKDIMKAWVHALLLAAELHQLEKFVPEKPCHSLDAKEKLHIIELTLRKAEARWNELLNGLELKGWDVETAAIETGIKWRVETEMDNAKKAEQGGNGKAGERVKWEQAELYRREQALGR